MLVWEHGLPFQPGGMGWVGGSILEGPSDCISQDTSASRGLYSGFVKVPGLGEGLPW